MNRSARELVKSWQEPDEETELQQLYPVESIALQRATKFLYELGLCPDLDRYPIKIFISLGGDILGRAENEEIHLARRAFQVGTKCVA